jgi:hypothetical protein
MGCKFDEQRGRPAAGHYTKRTAEAWLREILGEARRSGGEGTIVPAVDQPSE